MLQPIAARCVLPTANEGQVSPTAMRGRGSVRIPAARERRVVPARKRRRSAFAQSRPGAAPFSPVVLFPGTRCYVGGPCGGPVRRQQRLPYPDTAASEVPQPPQTRPVLRRTVQLWSRSVRSGQQSCAAPPALSCQQWKKGTEAVGTRSSGCCRILTSVLTRDLPYSALLPHFYHRKQLSEALPAITPSSIQGVPQTGHCRRHFA